MPWDNAKGYSIGPSWLRLCIGPYGNGWAFYAFRRRIAWKPIDYDQAAIFSGVRRWGYPKIMALDLR